MRFSGEKHAIGNLVKKATLMRHATDETEPTRHDTRDALRFSEFDTTGLRRISETQQSSFGEPPRALTLT
ncbi:hypothetical protein GWI33_019412 [Rhynchophorus ferrugineus]|uniref:Uncharacterized protein n=1 Tax=Rhynchophorus ferrugineus TaxID=354439 RepID=A0A834HSV5_RHYFE|nr:hypothetical protein GWI33_019412 [Rhynchophorus ferrugineus]